jgi:hypothetical protein
LNQYRMKGAAFDLQDHYAKDMHYLALIRQKSVYPYRRYSFEVGYNCRDTGLPANSPGLVQSQ